MKELRFKKEKLSLNTILVVVLTNIYVELVHLHSLFSLLLFDPINNPAIYSSSTAPMSATIGSIYKCEDTKGWLYVAILLRDLLIWVSQSNSSGTTSLDTEGLVYCYNNKFTL